MICISEISSDYTGRELGETKPRGSTEERRASFMTHEPLLGRAPLLNHRLPIKTADEALMKLDVQRHGGRGSRVTAEGVKNKQSNQSALNVTARPPWRNTPVNKHTLMTMLTLLVQVVSGKLQSDCSNTLFFMSSCLFTE